jgi:RNA polymerase sigma-70 factor (ECF subfamily)
MPLDDLELVRRVVAGDNQACAELDAQHRSRIEHIARARGVPACDCGEVAQEALASAFRQLRAGRFRGDSRLTTWLYRIITGAIADYWRQHGGRNQLLVPLDNSPQKPGADAVHFTTPADQETRLLVEQVFAEMPTRLAIILQLNLRGGLTTNQIAERLNLSSGRTGALLAEAKRKFRALVSGHEERRSLRRLKDKET